MRRFEWDEEKARANLRKHGVSFEEAALTFGDWLHITRFDPLHSTDEGGSLPSACQHAIDCLS